MDTAASSLSATLIEAGNIDTVYRDVYVDRARTLLTPVLSPDRAWPHGDVVAAIGIRC